MATSSTPLLGSPRRFSALGLLLAGGILFVLGLGGSSLLLGSDCAAGHVGAEMHGRA
jgi:hypothetical protein